jgi:hypothetical protein
MHDVKRIIEAAKETLTIEFKREWYWNKINEDKGTQDWDEFLKDFSALCNVIDDNKYLIFGVSDDGNNAFNYFEDSTKNKLKFFDRDLDEIKNDIIKKILTSFECYYFDNESLDNERDIFFKNIIFSIVDIKDNQVLVIKINQFPFLLRLQKDRNLKKYREKSILIRTINNDGPGCTVLDEDEKEKYKTHFDIFYHKFKMLSSKNTIKYMIEAYAKFLYNRYSIVLENEDNISYSNSNFFEVYSINQNQKYLEIFIYFSKYSSIQKVLENEILKKYLTTLKKYQEIYVVFEEQRDFKRIISKIKVDTIIVENNKVCIGKKEIKYFDSSTVFIEERIYNQIKNDIENEVLFPKVFSGVFVNPLINDADIDIISIMKTWINTKHSPMFALIGGGGVGKTTIAKKFCSQIENDIIFIDSKDLISNLKYIEKLNTLYDFVKLFIQSQDDLEIDENYFNEELINILVDSGKLLIVIDGLDEVILNYSDFDLNAFIETIYKNCLDNLGKTKILLTIRDPFWKKEYKSKIESFIINGFNINKSKEYFLKKLENDKLAKKAIELLQDNLTNENIFSPFILEVISLTIENKISKDSIYSDFICSDIFIDVLVYHICDREVIKFPNIHDKKIDEQIKFFIKMSIEYNGEITLKQLFNIFDKNIADAYKTHVLLYFDGDKLSFKFDILIEYFKMLNIINIINQNLYNYNENLLVEANNQLCKQVYLDDKNLVRIDGSIEELKFLYLQILDKLEILNELDKYLYVYSFILSITLRVNNKQDKQSNTELIDELLNKEDIHIGLCLSNNHLHDKFLFNFNDMKFKYSYVDYKYFGDSNFNGKTKFCNSLILGYYDIKYNFSEINFDTSSILSESMKKILEVKEENILDLNKRIKDNILDILKKFYRHSFKEMIKERLKNIDDSIFRFLVKEGLIIKQYITTSKKRKEESFTINEKYQSDIEMILNNQIGDLKLINELVEKYRKN